VTITSVASIKIIQEQQRGWIAVQCFGQNRNNSCTWWMVFVQCSKTHSTSRHLSKFIKRNHAKRVFFS